MKTNFSKVIHSDTYVDCENKKYEREYLLEEKLNEFASSELVITDRMHGMVFAAITGTPCIALSNYNHKLKGEFEWLEHLGYIKYAKNLEEVLKLIDEIKPQIGVKHNYSNKRYLKYFDRIIEICCE